MCRMNIPSNATSSPVRSWGRAGSLLGTLALAVLLGACVAPPQPGMPASELQRLWGTPNARHVLPEGAQRLKYASGPEGRTTWMVDVDAVGRVQLARQVLTESHLMEVQAAAPMPVAELLRRIGRPADVRGARAGGQTWSWRYETNECLWFQFSIDAAGIAQAGGFAIDWRCDAPSDARD
jgi:hypothetical protein